MMNLANCVNHPIVSLMLCFGGYTAQAQTQPDTDIFLVDIDLNRQPVQVGKPVNITQRKGYDNQPSFTPDGGSLLYTAIGTDGQADSYRYDLRQRTTTALTQTPESEYSPTVTPDDTHVSVIRVEKDQSQRLWQFPLSGTGAPTLILPNLKPVGYHCWLTPNRLALFVLGQPNALYIAEVSTGDTTRVVGNIGRALLRIPGKNALSFVQKRTTTDWDINQLDLATQQIKTLAQTLKGSEDFVWTPGGTLLMAQGMVLYQLNPADQRGWLPIADFSTSIGKQLTRLAIDAAGKRLALVGQ